MRSIAVVLSLSSLAIAQDAPTKTIPVAGSVHMFMGQGGNVGISVGDDGAFLIDDQFATSVGPIKAAVAKLTDADVRFVLNTHFHGDHTGGNERLGSTGSIIVAHRNVRQRMSTEQFNKTFQRTTPPQPAASLPIVTFAEEVTLHLNGDEVMAFHVPNAHTDGDAIIWFKKANVVHMGDVFFHRNYPYIDVGSGGSLRGVIAAVDRVLEIVDGETKIIPGHGELADRKGLEGYRAVLQEVYDRVAKLVREGKSIDEVRAAKPTADWDEEWGQGFMKPDVWLGIVYESVKAEIDAGK